MTEPLNFEAVYREHFAFVWRTLRRMGVAERDAQDACQKVFIVAFRRIGEFEQRSTLKTWLCGIALRVHSEYRRRASVRREVLCDEPIVPMTPDDRQLQQLERIEQRRELDEILLLLPEEQRTVFILFELEEMSGEDIAMLTGAPEGTVRSRLRLARRAFSKILADRRPVHFDAAAGGAA